MTRFEPDDVLSEAQAVPSDGSVQTRNFYPAGDVDWVRLVIGPGTYVIATSVSNNLYPDTMIALYASNGHDAVGLQRRLYRLHPGLVPHLHVERVGHAVSEGVAV